jgi:hypothetical protein
MAIFGILYISFPALYELRHDWLSYRTLTYNKLNYHNVLPWVDLCFIPNNMYNNTDIDG